MKTLLVQQSWLVVSLLVTWLVLSVPVSLVGGSVAWLTVAAALCFLPGCLVLALQPIWKLIGAAGFGAMSGTVLRMVGVAAGLGAVTVGRSGVVLPVFALELSVFYLVALWVETLLVVRDLDCSSASSTDSVEAVQVV